MGNGKKTDNNGKKWEEFRENVSSVLGPIRPMRVKMSKDRFIKIEMSLDVKYGVWNALCYLSTVRNELLLATKRRALYYDRMAYRRKTVYAKRKNGNRELILLMQNESEIRLIDNWVKRLQIELSQTVKETVDYLKGLFGFPIAYSVVRISLLTYDQIRRLSKTSKEYHSMVRCWRKFYKTISSIRAYLPEYTLWNGMNPKKSGRN